MGRENDRKGVPPIYAKIKDLNFGREPHVEARVTAGQEWQGTGLRLWRRQRSAIERPAIDRDANARSVQEGTGSCGACDVKGGRLLVVLDLKSIRYR